MDDQSAIEKDFLKWWDVMEATFTEQFGSGMLWAKPMINLITQLREHGYDRLLRPGQSMGQFVVSRSRTHGLRPGQAWLGFTPNPTGSMTVEYYEHPQGHVQLEVDRMELTPEIEPLLQKLLEQPID